MNQYVVLLRGINISGQKKIKMADLRIYLDELNVNDVRTYIQTGNVLLLSKESDSYKIANAIEQKIYEKYEFNVKSFVITPKYLRNIRNNNPFLDDQTKDINRTYITFLENEPDEKLEENLRLIDTNPEMFHRIKKIMYFYVPIGFERGVLSNSYFEKKLKVQATTRNWKTINKLIELTNE